MIEFRPEDLRIFVAESNRIEGIVRPTTNAELVVHAAFLNTAPLTVADVEAFVKVVANRPLRRKLGEDVRVGDHIAPPGGPKIEHDLKGLLIDACDGADPWMTHCRYETLHPFLDGNGRSGRAIWLWQMIHQHDAYHALRMGFLHLFYYQTLSNSGDRSSRALDLDDGAERVRTLSATAEPNDNS